MRPALLPLAMLAAAGSGVLAAPRTEVDPGLPHYEPLPFSIPKDAGYVRPDGSILVVGAEEMTAAIQRLNALFIQTHPGTKITTVMSGSSLGAPAVLFDVAAFGAVDRLLLPEEIVPFDSMYHRKPLGIRIGRGSYSKPGYTPPIAICVNKANPIEELTTEQVARIFTVGGGKGDLTSWGQLGLSGPWARRQIEVIGMVQRTGEGVFMKVAHFGDFPYTNRYEELKSAQIGARLSEEASAIAMVDLANLPPDAKIVAIGASKDGYYSRASLEDVAAGRYPYASYTYFYLNRDPGRPLDPFAKEYLRMVLSKEGQEALVDEPNGFLPLLAGEVRTELGKLD